MDTIKTKLPLIAVIPGDPNGIGPEIVLKALTAHPQIHRHCRPLVFADPMVLEYYANTLGLPVKIIVTDQPETAHFAENKIFCYPVPRLPAKIQPGTISGTAGKYAFNCIRTATAAALEKTVQAVTTGPINKKALKQVKIPYADHTAMFAGLTKSGNPMTMFVTRELRIFFYSRHIAFREIPNKLKVPDLVNCMRNCVRFLEQLGINRPALALAALNPHAGDGGLFGNEEAEILEPAVQQARARQLNISGPIPADSVFHFAAQGDYDAVLSLYHDQGHIAAKSYDFYRTVSFTMGLPFLRTSVDHGTAMELAGKGKANESSMVEAIIKAARFAW